jgi:hypothetical protein
MLEETTRPYDSALYTLAFSRMEPLYTLAHPRPYSLYTLEYPRAFYTLVTTSSLCILANPDLFYPLANIRLLYPLSNSSCLLGTLAYSSGKLTLHSCTQKQDI